MPCDRCDSRDAKKTILNMKDSAPIVCMMCVRCRLFYNGTEAPEHPMTGDYIITNINRNLFPKSINDEVAIGATRWVYDNIRHHLEELNELWEYPRTNAGDIKKLDKEILKALPAFKDAYPQFKQSKVNFTACCDIVRDYLKEMDEDE